MAKQKMTHVCGECGYESARWMGQCPSCESWNTLVEQLSSAQPSRSAASVPVRLVEVTNAAKRRLSTGMSEFDRVLGGGLVLGSAVLVGGDPGIGKSTILLQVSETLSRGAKVLYASGEESAAQIKLRAERLGVSGENVYILCETDLDEIEAQARKLNPGVMIIDSIQTVYRNALASSPGSVSQVREATSALTRLAKQTGAAVFIVGHVTKEGAIAGPMMLEHLVDTVLYFEGDRHDSFRILRAVKNRFGSTNEIGVFEMRDAGMQEVQNPSALFLSEREGTVPGCAIVCAMEGSRPVVAELQALVSPTAFSTPRRMATGIDYNRMILLTAVLEKKLGLKLSLNDVYLNVVGGLKIDERAADLAIMAAVVSSLENRPVKRGAVAIGEAGLTGELRSVNAMDKRVCECEKLGFTRCVVPKQNLKTLKAKGMQLIGADTVFEALNALLED